MVHIPELAIFKFAVDKQVEPSEIPLAGEDVVSL
jgi:hypothetical protein